MEFVEANGLSSDLIQIETLRERDRRLVVQTRLRALPVVEDFDVFADRQARLLARGEALMIDQFIRQRSSEGFDRGRCRNSCHGGSATLSCQIGR